MEFSIPFMRGTGFEPAQALSYRILSPARLTTPTPSHKKHKYRPLINFVKEKFKKDIFIEERWKLIWKDLKN